MVDEKFTDELDEIGAASVAKVEAYAQSLGDHAFEEALGLVQRWMSLVSLASRCMLADITDFDSNPIEPLQDVCNHLEALQAVLGGGCGIDMQYVMSTESTFNLLLQKASLHAVDTLSKYTKSNLTAKRMSEQTHHYATWTL